MKRKASAGHIFLLAVLLFVAVAVKGQTATQSPAVSSSPAPVSSPAPSPAPSATPAAAPQPKVVKENFETACYDQPLGGFEAGDFVLQQARRSTFSKQVRQWTQEGWRKVMFFNNTRLSAVSRKGISRS